MDDKKILKKNFLWNFIGSTLNGFNSLFFMIIITRMNGVDDAGSFSLLFSLACLFYIIGGYAGRTYQVADKSGINSDDDYLAQRYITCGLMLAAGIIYCLVMKYDAMHALLLITLTVLKAIEAFSDVFYGLMQKKEKLYLAGMSASIKTVLSIAVFLIVDFLTKNIVMGFAAAVIVWLIVLFTFDQPFSGKALKPVFNKEGISHLFRRGFYSFAFLFMGVFLANATKYAMDGRTLASEQAKYGIVLMPATLISLCCLYILQPYINRLANYHAAKQYTEFRKTVRRIFITIAGLAVLALLVASTIGIPVLAWVYGVNLDGYVLPLQLIAVGASMNAAITLLSTALTIMYKTKMQFYIYLAVSIFAFVLSPLMIDHFGVSGAAFSYLIIMTVQSLAFICYYEYECRKEQAE